MSHPFRALAPSRLSDRLSSLILHWNGDDQSLDCLSGQVGTFVRATAGGAMIDANGALWHSVRNQARWEMVLDNQTGLWRPGLLLDPARTNKVKSSENLGNATDWDTTGTPTISAAYISRGDLVLDLVGDDNGAALEGYSTKNAGMVFTGNGTKVVRCFVRQGTATSTAIRLLDVTATTVRLLGLITWSGSTPTPSATTGTYVGKRFLADGIWELVFLTTSGLLAANDNRIYIYPAADGALTTSLQGTIGIGGVMASDTGPAGYIKTGAATASANAEELSWPFPLPRRRVWLYQLLTDLGACQSPAAGGGAGFAVLGDVTGCGLGTYPAGGAIGAFHYTTGSGGGPTPATVAVTPAFGTQVELLVTLDANGKVTIEVAFNGVSQGSAVAASNAVNMTTGWASAIARLGAIGSLGSHIIGGAAYHALKVGEYGLSTPTLAKARRYW